MRSQVSAELLIVIAALAALAVYVFNQMRQSSESLASKYDQARSKVENIISDLTGESGG